MTAGASPFDRWMADLEARHLADLTPTEVARALRALSATYVERRARLSGRGAFDSAGKRAAYALYYAPRRFKMVSHVLAALDPLGRGYAIADLGCGTGAAGAAWATLAGAGSTVRGLDSHPWALDEARATYRALNVSGQVRRGLVDAAVLQALAGPRVRQTASAPRSVVLSYTVNELSDDVRHALLPSLLAAADAGARVLILEPLSRRTSPWWPVWARAVEAAGGRADEWRLRLQPPAVTLALGKAAGLDPLEATGRTLWL